MILIEFSVRADDVDLDDASADIHALLDLDGKVFDLTPAFRRLLLDLDEAMTARSAPNQAAAMS